VTARELGINTSTDQGLFDWLLAALLFGRPIPQSIAVGTWRRLQADGWTTPSSFVSEDPHALWHELWEGNYHRLGSVMADELQVVMTQIIADYEGSVGVFVRSATSRAELTQRLEKFKGVGPKTAEIFLREVKDATFAK
jgi:endonuclease III